MYDYFKVYSSPERIRKMFAQDIEGRRRFIFVFDRGEFCEEAVALGFSAIYLPEDDDCFASVFHTISTMTMLGRRQVIFPLCGKGGTQIIEGALDESSHLVKSAWKEVFSKDKPRDYYLIYRDEFAQKIDALAKKYSGETLSEDVKIQRFSDIEERSTNWLWYPYISKGNITLLYAAPGAGKTFFTCYLAARVSRGEALPDMPPEQWVTPAKGITLFFNAEDPVDSTLKPRLRGCNADMSNIMTAETDNAAPYTLTDPRLPKLFEAVKPQLVIFDPIQSYIGADIDMHRANQTRPVLAHINALAAQYGFALVIVCHINKMSTQDISERILGSQDIRGAARSALFLGLHPDRPDTKVLFQMKNNLAEWGDPLAFRIDDSGGTAAFVPDPFADITGLTPDRCTGNAGRVKANEKRRTDKSRADELIKGLFKDRNTVTLGELKSIAEENGISWSVFYKVLIEYARYRKVGFSNATPNEDYYEKIS